MPNTKPRRYYLRPCSTFAAPTELPFFSQASLFRSGKVRLLEFSLCSLYDNSVTGKVMDSLRLVVPPHPKLPSTSQDAQLSDVGHVDHERQVRKQFGTDADGIWRKPADRPATLTGYTQKVRKCAQHPTQYTNPPIKGRRRRRKARFFARSFHAGAGIDTSHYLDCCIRCFQAPTYQERHRCTPGNRATSTRDHCAPEALCIPRRREQL